MAFAMALPFLDGLSMTEVAERFNVSKAYISKLAIKFAETHDLPASRYLKAEETRCAYSAARVESIKQNGSHEHPHRLTRL